MKDADFQQLIPELRLWNHGKGIDVDTWLRCVGSFEHAVAYGRLFWPDFTLYDGCVLFKGFDIERFRGFMEQTGGHRPSVERVMNHIHLLDLFGCNDQTPSDDLLVHLGSLLKDTWSTKLARDFPDRRVVVRFPLETVDDGSSDYQIAFFQPD